MSRCDGVLAELLGEVDAGGSIGRAGGVDVAASEDTRGLADRGQGGGGHLDEVNAEDFERAGGAVRLGGVQGRSDGYFCD